MSKDIRSYFTSLGNKKPGSKIVENKNIVKPTAIGSDDDDVIESTPLKTKKNKPTKRKVQVISSDSDESPKKKTVVTKTDKNKDISLKPVNIDDIFGNKTVTQSKVEAVFAKESPKPQEKNKKGSKSKPKTELGVHSDEDFEKTLLDLDDDILIDNVEELEKSIHETLNKQKHTDKPGSSKENSPKNKKEAKIESKAVHDSVLESANESGSKRKRLTSQSDADETPKKPKFSHSDSGIDPDQERFEKKRYSAMLYQRYKNRGGPKNHGTKALPQGKPDCLKNLIFVRTGVLDSLEGDEFDNLVKEHGGKVVHSVSKKVNFIVVGEEPGPAKLEKARGYKIKEIEEDDFLDMILVKSGLKPKFVRNKSDKSTESGIAIDEDLPQIETENELKQISNEPEVKEETISPKKSKLEKEKLIESHPKKEPESLKKGSKKPTLKNLSGISSSKKLNSDTKSIENTSKPHLPKKSIKNGDSDIIEKNHKVSSDLPQIERKKVVVSETDKSWTEKYKPMSMKAIIGQQDPNSNMFKLKKWLEKWHTNQLPDVKKRIPRPSPWAKNDDGAYFKAALLSGPPGVGKTTTSTMVCRELGLDIVEFNASDTRSKRLLHEEVAQLLSTTTIAGFAAGKKTTDNHRVLLMDEVDGMAGNEDRGGMQELINLIKNTSIPIICMCNDRNHQKMRSLVNHCFDLKFNKPRLEQIRGAMMSICFKEGLQLSPNTLTEIINGAGCDIRQTLNNLAMWTAGEKNLSLEMAQKEAKSAVKDTILGPWEVVKLVFTESEQKKMTFADKSRLFFYDYSINPLFVQENYLNVTPNCPSKFAIRQAALAADAISIGDIINAKIRGSNNWSLLESQAVFSSVLPGHYMSGHISKRINFPAWLGKNSSASKHRRILSEIHVHTRMSTSGSRLAILLDYIVPLRNAIIYPLKKYGVDGVHQSIEVMKSYSLIREDLTNLIELCQYKGSKNPFDEIDAKVKSAFTRVYNKEGPLLPFASSAGISKKKIAYTESDLIEENDDESDEEKDDLNKDNLIKIKTKTEAKGKGMKGSSKAVSSTTKNNKEKGKKGKKK